MSSGMMGQSQTLTPPPNSGRATGRGGRGAGPGAGRGRATGRGGCDPGASDPAQAAAGSAGAPVDIAALLAQARSNLGGNDQPGQDVEA